MSPFVLVYKTRTKIDKHSFRPSNSGFSFSFCHNKCSSRTSYQSFLYKTSSWISISSFFFWIILAWIKTKLKKVISYALWGTMWNMALLLPPSKKILRFWKTFNLVRKQQIRQFGLEIFIEIIPHKCLIHDTNFSFIQTVKKSF